jgi:hypothetical protein
MAHFALQSLCLLCPRKRDIRADDKIVSAEAVADLVTRS